MKTVPKDQYNGYKYTDNPRLCTCAYCKQQYKRYGSEIEYTTNFNHKLKKYCSYTCKQKAIKEHNRLLEQKEQQANRSLKDYLKYLIDQGYSYTDISVELNLNITKVATLIRKYKLIKTKTDEQDN